MPPTATEITESVGGVRNIINLYAFTDQNVREYAEVAPFKLVAAQD